MNDRVDSTPSESDSDIRCTSKTLLQRARDQQPEAWGRLVRLYDPLVRYWCRRAGANSQDIDDVVQDVFASAFAGLAAFRHTQASDTFRGWLHGVTQHRLLDHFRRVRRVIPATGGTDAFALFLEQPDVNSGPDDEERDLYGQLYRQVLEVLSEEFEPRTWTMFWRSVIDNVPTDTVAAELGVSAAAVRQARSRILRRVRQEVADLSMPSIRRIGN